MYLNHTGWFQMSFQLGGSRPKLQMEKTNTVRFPTQKLASNAQSTVPAQTVELYSSSTQTHRWLHSSSAQTHAFPNDPNSHTPFRWILLKICATNTPSTTHSWRMRSLEVKDRTKPTLAPRSQQAFHTGLAHRTSFAMTQHFTKM